MKNLERYRHYTIDSETNKVQWYFPLDISNYYHNHEDCAYIDSLTFNNKDIGMTHLGKRKFEAVMVPVSREQYLALIKDELREQYLLKNDGQCMIPAERGAFKRCPYRVANPDFSEGSDSTKTVRNSCEGCKYADFKNEHTFVNFSTLESCDDNGDTVSFEPTNPDGYNQADRYLDLRDKFIEYVSIQKPKLVQLVILLTFGYSKSEAARILGKRASTISSQNKVLQDLVKDFLESVA